MTSGAGTLKDAMNEAMRDWVANVEDTYYLIGTVAGPHPYPMMVRDFQSVIGEEAKVQLQEAEGRLPDAAVACIGGGSNAMGLFHPFLDDASVRLIGVEAGGHGIETGEHAASLTGGRPGVLHGNRRICCRMTTVRSSRRTVSVPVSIIRASGRSIPGCTISAASNTFRRPIGKRWTRSSFAPRRRGSFRHWNRRMRWRMSRSWRRR